MAKPISIRGINEADLAELSMASYGNNPVEGWRIRSVQLPQNADQHGFSAQVYQNSSTEQLVIAYRGSDGPEDWTGPNNAISEEALGFEGEDPQFVDALEFAEQVRQTFPEREILVTGHSLGGGLAQLAADAYGWGGMTFDAPGMKEITEGGSFSQFRDFFDSNPVTDGFGKVGQQGRFVNRPVEDSSVSGVGTPVGEVSELRFPGKSPAEILVSTMVTRGWRSGVSAVLVAGAKLGADQLERHSSDRIFQQLFERNTRPGQLVKDMTVQAVNNGVDGFDNPERGFFGDLNEFFSDLYAGEAELTQDEAKQLISDLEEVKRNHPAFADASPEEIANLEEAQDHLRRATQNITAVSANTDAWHEKAQNGNTLTVQVELQHAMDRGEQRIALDLPNWDPTEGRAEGYILDEANIRFETASPAPGVTLKHPVLVVGPGQETAELTLTASPDADSQDLNLGDLTLSLPGRSGPGTERTLADLTIQEDPLPDATQDAGTGRVIEGDLQWKDFDAGKDGIQTRTDDLGNVITVSDQADPGRVDTLRDSAGNDRILPKGGDDNVEAFRGGDDLVRAGGGEDRVHSGPGADRVEGQADADVISGGAGSDRLFGGSEIGLGEAVKKGQTDPNGGSQGEFVSGGYGEDRILTGSQKDMVSGGDGNDVLVTGAGDDVIEGDADTRPDTRDWRITVQESGTSLAFSVIGASAGNPDPFGHDVIRAGKGDDIGTSGPGSDSIFAGPGEDHFVGGGGRDAVQGGPGADVLHGDNGPSRLAPEKHGDDIIDGGKGDDELLGGGGADTLFGGAGSDSLSGGDPGVDPEHEGEDSLFGEEGDDELVGAEGDDSLSGGQGDDHLVGGASNIDPAFSGADFLDGGTGNDTLIGGGDQDRVLGGSGADNLQGDAGFTPGEHHGSDVLLGGPGDDQLTGAGGSDELRGGPGNDHLAGAAADLDPHFDGRNQLFGGTGQDTLVGGPGGESLVGQAGDDSLDGDGRNLAGAEHGDDFLEGGDGADELVGSGGSDDLFGGAKDDRLFGDVASLEGRFHGDDFLSGEEGSDQLIGGGQADQLRGGEGDDELFGDGNEAAAYHGSDELFGGSGDDRLFGLGETDTLDGGSGSDELYGQGGDDILFAGEGDDTLVGGPGADTYVYNRGDGTDTVRDSGFGNILRFGNGIAPGDLTLGIGSLQIDIAGAGALHFEGFDPENPFSSTPIDRVEFGDGQTLSREELISRGIEITGSGLDDVLIGTNAPDRISGVGGNDFLDGLEGNDVLKGGSGNDRLEGGLGSDELRGGSGDDSLRGFGGDHSLRNEHSSGDTLLGGSGDDSLRTVLGPDAQHTLRGGLGDDDLTSGSGADRLFGGPGADTLEPGFGADVVRGGSGSDLYHIYDLETRIIEQPQAGQDKVNLDLYELDPQEQELSYQLPQNVEDLEVDDGAPEDPSNEIDVELIGNDQDNKIAGSFQNDRILGKGGNDDLRGASFSGDSARDVILGGEGDDTYYISDVPPYRDELIEREGEGQDRVFVEGSYTLNPHFEDLILEPNDGLKGTGNKLGNFLRSNENSNLLAGKAGEDELDGRGGADLLKGGPGDDSLFGGRNSWTFVSGSGSGERGATGFSIRVAPNRDVLQGGTGDDRLNGGSGDDVLKGGKGSDVLIGGEKGEAPPEDLPFFEGTPSLPRVGEAVSEFVDLEIPFRRSFPKGFFRTNNDELFGGLGADTLRGGTGQDVLWGGPGADLLRGGPGDDELHVDDPGDEVRERANGGYDVVLSSISYRLPDHVEELRLEGSAPLNGTGNAQDNRLVGNAGDNRLNGLGGEDVLVGGPGNDTFRVQGEGDRIVEKPGEGDNDIVRTGVSYTLGSNNVENLELIGSDPADLTGNETDNRLSGNDAANELAGLGGDDLLIGGGGPDRLVGGAGADRAGYQGSGEGVWVDLSSGEAAGGTAEGDELQGIEGLVGSSFADELVGDAAANRLEGGDGDDVLEGGGGDDRLVAGSGEDLLQGDAGRDFLAAGPGPATLQGGADPDTFAYDLGNGPASIEDPGSSNSVVFGEGIESGSLTLGLGSLKVRVPGAASLRIKGFNPDAPFADVTISEYRFADGTVLTHEELLERGFDTRGTAGDDDLSGTAIEDRIRGLEGSDWIRAKEGDDRLFGGSGEDRLFGGRGADRLKGGAGADFLLGGQGDDTLSGGAGRDNLLGGRGTDTADYSAKAAGVDVDLGARSHGFFRFRMDANEDVLRSIENLTGSDHDDRLTGDGEANRLAGGAGADRLAGGAGDDALIGGPGFDTAVFRDSRRGVTVDLDAGTARRERGHGFGWRRGGKTEETDSLSGIEAVVGGRGRDELTGDGGANRLVGGFGADRLAGAGGADDLVGGALSDHLSGGAGADRLAGGEHHDRLRGQAGTDWLRGGDGRDRAEGGTGSDAVEGGDRGDALAGGAGSDFLAGGDGLDRLDATAGSDVVAFNRGDDRTRVETGAESGTLTLSLGGGIGLDDLTLARRGKDLLLGTGESDRGHRGGFGRGGFSPGGYGRHGGEDRVRLEDWYADGGENRPDRTWLQMVVEARDSFDPAGDQAHLQKRLQRYDFDKIARAFDESRQKRRGGHGRGGNRWEAMDAALDSHLEGTDAEAVGGELARRYGVKGTLEGLSRGSVVATLADERFGEKPQALKGPNAGGSA